MTLPLADFISGKAKPSKRSNAHDASLNKGWANQLRQNTRVMQINKALNELPPNEWITRKQLGEICGVCEKTIGAYIEHMRNILLPILDGPKGYRYSEPVELVPHLLMSRRLCYTLMLAMKSSRGYCGAAQKRAITTLFERLTSSLHENGTLDYEEMDLCLSFGNILRPRYNPERIEYLWRCAVEKIELEVDYDTPGKGVFRRILRCLNVRRIRNEWIAICWDSKNNKPRRFSLSQMRKIVETGKKFIRPEDFDLNDYTDGAFDVFMEKDVPKTDVKIYFTPKKAHIIRQNDVSCEVGRKEMPCGGLELHLQISSFVDILSFIGEFRGEAIPMEPRNLVEEWVADCEKGVARGRAVLEGTFQPGQS